MINDSNTNGMETFNLEDFTATDENLKASKSKIGFNEFRCFDPPKEISVEGEIFNYSHYLLASVWGPEFVYKNIDGLKIIFGSQFREI